MFKKNGPEHWSKQPKSCIFFLFHESNINSLKKVEDIFMSSKLPNRLKPVQISNYVSLKGELAVGLY